MRRVEVLIVGGGPAGAVCATRLVQAGVDCLVLDQAAFPRPKVCAGWVTPRLWRELAVDPGSYPLSLTRFDSFQVAVRSLRFTLPTRQYAVRRVEFDAWLLQRSGAPLEQHRVREIQAADGGYALDGLYWGRYLVGAGGTHCPVRTALFSAASRPADALIAAMEQEFPYPVRDPRCHLWFLQNGLPGYAWYVPKQGGYLNVGIGGAARALQHSGTSLRQHWDRLVQKLDEMGLVRGHAFKPAGHSYYLRRPSGPLRLGNALLVGDSAGLSTLDMGEGIGPAVQSGLLAAEAIQNGGPYSLDSIPRYSLWSLLLDK